MTVQVETGPAPSLLVLSSLMPENLVWGAEPDEGTDLG